MHDRLGLSPTDLIGIKPPMTYTFVLNLAAVYSFGHCRDMIGPQKFYQIFTFINLLLNYRTFTSSTDILPVL